MSDGASLKSVRGAIDYESGALPSRFIGQSLAGLGDGIGIDRVTHVTRFALFQMLGKVQDPLAGDSPDDAPGAQKTAYAERVKTRVSHREVGRKGPTRDQDPR